MKKVLFACLTAFLMACVPAVQAQGLSKEEKKEAKAAAKEMVKDGWKVQGLGTIEGNMIRLMTRQAQGDALLNGVALGGYREAASALSECMTQAINEYVKTTGSAIVKERVTSAVGRNNGVDYNELVDMAEQNFKKELKGELGMPVLKLQKGSPSNGTYELQCWWMLNEDKMAMIREKAIQQALANVEGASAIGDGISKFVNDGQDAE